MKESTFLLAGDTYTKLAVELRVKNILHESHLGVELDAHAQAFMMDLLRRHPEAEKKIGTGIRAIRITNSKYGNRCFEAIRVDGTSTDFSYLKCLKQKRERARG